MSQSTDLSYNIDTLAQELATIQQMGSKRIAVLGSRHVPITHQNLIEMMTYALVLSGNRVITSGATGTNSAAIKGAMRADPNFLTVILPQSLDCQPLESRQQLEQVMHLVKIPAMTIYRLLKRVTCVTRRLSPAASNLYPSPFTIVALCYKRVRMQKSKEKW